MAGSGVFRKRKQEPVQFWLAVAAGSMLVHAVLILSVKRWVKVAIVEPQNTPPIEFQVVEAGNSAPEGEPIIQAAAMKPEARPIVEPEAKPPVEPEPEIKAKPLVKTSEKPVEKPIVKPVEKPIEKPIEKPKERPIPAKTKPKPPEKTTGLGKPISSGKPLQEPGEGTASNDGRRNGEGGSGTGAGTFVTMRATQKKFQGNLGEFGAKQEPKLDIIDLPANLNLSRSLSSLSSNVVLVTIELTIDGFKLDDKGPHKKYDTFEIKDTEPQLNDADKEIVRAFISSHWSYLQATVKVDPTTLINPANQLADTTWDVTFSLSVQ